MTILQAVILGILQGFTEFLPISSDGHLVLAEWILGISLSPGSALGFDVLLHLGSLLALLLVDAKFWYMLLRRALCRDSDAWSTILCLVIATIPAVVAGLAFQRFVEGMRGELFAALGFLVTALVLILGESIGRRQDAGSRYTDRRPFLHALLIGCAQAVALLPGVSRSGLTTSMGRAIGLPLRRSLDVSFMIAVPILAGVSAKTLFDLRNGSVAFPSMTPAIIGLLISFVCSVAAILLLRAWVRRQSLAWFAWYLVPVAFLLLWHAIGIERLGTIQNLRAIVLQYGAFAVFIFVLVETIPPMSFFWPGVLMVIVAGSFAATAGQLALFFMAALGGAALGNMVMFLLGREAGDDIAARMHLTKQHLHRARSHMTRFGVAGVAVGQFIGALRPIVMFSAGTLGMHRGRFYSSMLLGTSLWAFTYLAIGFFLGVSIGPVLSIVGIGGTLCMGAAMLVVWFLECRIKKTAK